jgi:hypothetical protein
MEHLRRSEGDWYVDGYARRLYRSSASYAFGIVALQPNITTSMTGNQGKLMSQEKTVSNTFFWLIP